MYSMVRGDHHHGVKPWTLRDIEHPTTNMYRGLKKQTKESYFYKIFIFKRDHFILTLNSLVQKSCFQKVSSIKAVCSELRSSLHYKHQTEQTGLREASALRTCCCPTSLRTNLFRSLTTTGVLITQAPAIS